MKRITKTVVAGVIIAIVGVVVLLCALGASGWNFKQANNWEKGTFSTDSQITKLKIEANVGKVSITRGSTNAVRVKYQYNDRYQPEFKEKEDGTLSITTVKKHWYEFGYWFDDAPYMDIEIGEEYFPLIELQLNAGTVHFYDGDWGRLIDVELNAGTVTFGNVAVVELRVEINAGSFYAGNITCEQFKCDVSAGSVIVNKLNANVVDVDVSAGSASLALTGFKSEYNITVDKSAGSCNVSSQTGTNPDKRIKIDVSAGSVSISFDN